MQIKSMDQRRREAVHEALRATDGNVSDAADALGIARSTFYRWMDEFRVEPNFGMGFRHIGQEDQDSDDDGRGLLAGAFDE